MTEPTANDPTPEAPPEPTPGVLWDATIATMGDEYIDVDLGHGHKGRMEAIEARFPENTEGLQIKAGDTIPVLVDNREGEWWTVSMDKANKIKIFDRLMELSKTDVQVTGTVTRRVRGGLSLDIGVRAFLPARESGLRNNELDHAVGRTLTCVVKKYDLEKNEVVLTRKELAEQEQAKLREGLYSTLEVGAEVTGTVTSITRFGAFLDLGGVDGLLHVSEMSWKRVGRPESVVALGNTLRVKVIEIDRERDRIGLSLKDMTPNPWLAVAEDFSPNTRAKGPVTSITEFGAFVRLADGVEGLVHISELTWDRSVKHPSAVTAVGEELEVVVLNVDVETQRLSLSHKRLTPSPWQMALEDINTGDRIEGAVTSVVDFGVFVELRTGVEGLVHVSDMSWTERIERPSDLRDFQPGDACEVIVLNIDPDRERISLGIKQLEGDPWADATANLNQGDIIDVTISRIESFGAFATIAEHVEGLIHISEIAQDRVDSIEHHLKHGQEAKVKIINLDRKSRKIGLSIKAYLEQDTMHEYSEDASAGTSLGALLMAKGIVTEEATPSAAVDGDHAADEDTVAHEETTHQDTAETEADGPAPTVQDEDTSEA
ncbi:MAG: S1 RNA-binding domain-containing protein [Myxococcota bacterium]